MNQRRQFPHVPQPIHNLGVVDEALFGSNDEPDAGMVADLVTRDAEGQHLAAVANLMNGPDPQRLPPPPPAAADDVLGNGSIITGPHPEDEWRYRVSSSSSSKRRRRDTATALLDNAMRRAAISEGLSSSNGSESSSVQIPAFRQRESTAVPNDYEEEEEDGRAVLGEEGDDHELVGEDEEGEEEDDDDDDGLEDDTYCYLCAVAEDARNMYLNHVREIIDQARYCGVRWVCVRASQFYDTNIRPTQPGCPKWTPQGVLAHLEKHNPTQEIVLLEDMAIFRQLLDGHRRNIHVTDATGKILPANKQTTNDILAIIKARQTTVARLSMLQSNTGRGGAAAAAASAGVRE